MTQMFTNMLINHFVPEVTSQIKAAGLSGPSGTTDGFHYDISGLHWSSLSFSGASISFTQGKGMHISLPVNFDIEGKF